MSRPDVALVLVDFDDTLVDTAPRFLGARRALFERLVALGFDESESRAVHHDEVDPQLMRRFGFGPGRLEHSFRETYLALCGHHGTPPDASVTEELEELGRAVAGTPPLLDGALEALERLARALPTVLYTQSGEPEYQLQCVREAGVTDILGAERIRIAGRKTVDAFRDALAHYGVADPRRVWMVGNSIRSDVNPALLVGANAILVAVPEPWEFDIVEPVSRGYLRAGSFADAVEFLLTGRGAEPQGD